MKKYLMQCYCNYYKKLKKHNKKSKSHQKKVAKKALRRKARNGFSSDRVYLPIEAKLSNELGKLYDSTSYRYKIKKGMLAFYIPKQFDIYKNPKSTLITISNFRYALLDKRVTQLALIHDDVESCVASEFLIGLLAKEIDEYRRKAGFPFDIKGIVKDDGSQFKLLKSIGIIAEIESDKKEAHSCQSEGTTLFYRRDNSLNHTASSTANDIKNQTSSECVEHLKSCLFTQALKLNEDVEKDIEMCLGEVLDNVHEHCGMTAPIWFVRSYLNTEIKEKRFFDLVVMNLGRSISETFDILPEDSAAKALAMEYVDYHEEDFDRDALITVAALQGNVSSKKDENSTRGQGTIRLIEMFDSIYQSYKTLRGNDCDTAAIMNLISGSTIITFDGTYSSCRKDDDETGIEDVTVPFNRERSLRELPDSRCVKKMEGVHFPGVMLNIRIPLTGSTTPIERAE